MEPTTGIEPVNLILTKDVLYLLSYVGPFGLTPPAFRKKRAAQLGCTAIAPRSLLKAPSAHLRCRLSVSPDLSETRSKRIAHCGAGNGTRTRDPQLGRLTL